MSCPVCHGSAHRVLTPGYVECTNSVTVPVPTGAIRPEQGPMLRPFVKQCGHRYHVSVSGTQRPQCAYCGLESIGTCDHCGRPLCGIHGTPTLQGFFCAEYLAEVALTEAERLREQREIEAREAEALHAQQHQRAVDSNLRAWGEPEDLRHQLAALARLQDRDAARYTPRMLVAVIVVVVGIPVSFLVASAWHAITDASYGYGFLVGAAVVFGVPLAWRFVSDRRARRARARGIEMQGLRRRIGCGQWPACGHDGCRHA